MKKLFKPCLLVLWLSIFYMVALASCNTNNAGEQSTVERIIYALWYVQVYDY